jgi:hypothetical protein
MPTTPNGCIDICAIITPQTTTTQRTRASMLERRLVRNGKCGRPWHRLWRVLVRRYEGRDKGGWLAVSRV